MSEGMCHGSTKRLGHHDYHVKDALNTLFEKYSSGYSSFLEIITTTIFVFTTLIV